MALVNTCCQQTAQTLAKERGIIAAVKQGHGEAHVQSHDKWDYPNQESSKYCLMFNWIHTMIYRMPNCCQKIVLHSY